jgi:hypothetical protein
MNGSTEAKTRREHDRAKQLLDLALRREISRVSDMDELGKTVKERARKLVQAHQVDMAQIRGLENIAYSTTRISDITDHLKQQIGRSDPGKRWRYESVGQEILTDLSDGFLPNQVKDIAHKLNAAYPNVVDDDLPRRVHLTMCRVYVRQLTANFLYETVQQKGSPGGNEA